MAERAMAARGRETVAGRFGWNRRASLTFRILAVNIIALGLMAGSLFYLDSYRKQLLAERYKLATTEAEIIADALAIVRPQGREPILGTIGSDQDLRLRLFAGDGRLVADSFALSGPSFTLTDPATEPWYQNAARTLDRGMDFLLGAEPVPPYHEDETAHAGDWPEIGEARERGGTVVRQRYAPDRTPIITAATPVGRNDQVLLSLRNAPDITQSVRDARQTLAIVVGIALAVSIQLSLFLARTIVQPLRALVRAAVRVRLGRERAVVVPRLPERGDEIGLLARAISDMTSALRQRIDAVEAFAADVAHEIKNPLASLRSALESLDKVDDPALRRQLAAIAAHDVQRIDRLVTEIADASRIDAELSRTTFEEVDLDSLARSLVGARAQRGVDAGRRVLVAEKGRGPWQVAGDPARLERVLDNLLDNAVSFSPPAGTISLSLQRRNGTVELAVSDEGPGIPPEHRDKVFERFHSLRPDSEDFGRHSGLGLAIARTIAEAHEGSLVATERSDGRPGANLVLSLPALGDEG
jgi:two-component system, OmpR family, sensor histidine kinase ChvG